MADAPLFVLDTFALLAYLQGESSGARLREIFQSAQSGTGNVYISIINLGEVLYITERKNGIRKAQEVLASIRQLPIEVLPADEQAVFAAAHIKANHVLSYADSFAVAAAIDKNAVILTDDPEFESVESIATIEWLKKSLGKPRVHPDQLP